MHIETAPMRYAAITCLLFITLAGPGTAFGESDVYITKKNCPMAATERDLIVFYNSMQNNHTGLWIKLRQEKRAWLSDAGVAVVIVEKKEPNIVKVRALQSNIESWTMEDSLSKK
jgi:hypothetical protein